MKYRSTNVFAEKSYTADFTELIDLNVGNPISELLIKYKGLNTTGTAGATAHPAKCVTKVEITNGSDVLYSLSGLDLYALSIIHNKNVAANWFNYLNDCYFDLSLRVNFGRRLWDPELALDPKQFPNLQLKVTSDMDAGGVAPDASKLDVWAHCFDQEEISPIGFLSSKLIKEYTLGDASHEYTELPTDMPIRKIMFRALLAGTEPYGVIAHVKLDEDNDRHVIIDCDSDNLQWLFPEENIKVLEGFAAQNDGSQRSYYCTPTAKVFGNVNQWTAGASAYFAYYDGDGGRCKIDGTAAENFNCQLHGYLPNGVSSIPMGNQDIIEDWFDPESLKSLRLDLKSASSMTTAAQILLQTLRRY
jgi:hypothetical protein